MTDSFHNDVIYIVWEFFSYLLSYRNADPLPVKALKMPYGAKNSKNERLWHDSHTSMTHTRVKLRRKDFGVLGTLSTFVD